QPNGRSGNGHASGDERPGELHRSARPVRLLWPDRPQAVLVIDREAGPPQHVEPDDSVDAHAAQVREIADHRRNRSGPKPAELKSLDDGTVDWDLLSERDERGRDSLEVQLLCQSNINDAGNRA